MDRVEYKAYCRRVGQQMDLLTFLSTGGCPGCEECGIPEDAEHYQVDPYFSWAGCDICGSTLGGDMQPGHYINDDGMITHIENVCTDCVYFLEYGHLDDQTMLDIEAS